MKFNNWNIIFEGKDDYDILTNDNKIILIQNFENVEAALIVNDNSVQIKQVGYTNDITIKAETKEIVINVVDVFDEE
ncbi:hypothetical protein KJB58_08640 [Staphylococcus hyicus]|uniref:hypothetical protein n=1 Tax=Staphylococcus hyicus TaxID=1284 RepID=UPI00057C924F|nr:hypothetical protein [Staphylococcus hyicus]AJC95870.1 hypothetical protein SHYC_05630 [Staphylococcus hyicus]MCE5154526.1 hypothetical protein [Staphylococcus hyicus]MCQ9291118.1 hypothetical protein [Staphylococcus hyicus]MCQ9306359.1 hypothetical protein [Staphylococcus hyicus]MCQ9308772.1 hypothetical protein [Staphylococcus hyicus]